MWPLNILQSWDQSVNHFILFILFIMFFSLSIRMTTKRGLSYFCLSIKQLMMRLVVSPNPSNLHKVRILACYGIIILWIHRSQSVTCFEKEYKGNRNWWLSWTLSLDISFWKLRQEDIDNRINDNSYIISFLRMHLTIWFQCPCNDNSRTIISISARNLRENLQVDKPLHLEWEQTARPCILQCFDVP